MKKSQSGFAALEVLLILGVVTIIGFTGWFVWNGQKSINKTLSDTNTSAGSTSTQPQKKTDDTKPVKDETATWLLYQPAGKEYSVRLADGWTVQQLSENEGVHTFSNKDLALKSGTLAIVQPYPGGRDGSSGFGLLFVSKSEYTQLGEKLASLKTSDGLDVAVYKYTQTTDPDGIGLPKGGISYYYQIAAGSKGYVVCSYSFVPGDVDYHEVVEKVVKTVHIN